MENHRIGMIIPHDRLSMEVLQGLIEEFVSRDGTDTGYTEGSLEESVEMVMRQLVRGDVVIVFDEVTGTANIVPKEDARSNFSREGLILKSSFALCFHHHSCAQCLITLFPLL